jgi:hypothetical protein
MERVKKLPQRRDRRMEVRQVAGAAHLDRPSTTQALSLQPPASSLQPSSFRSGMIRGSLGNQKSARAARFFPPRFPRFVFPTLLSRVDHVKSRIR